MTLEEFLNKYSNDIISDELLTNIYICTDIARGENMDDFEFLFPAIKELFYCKTYFKQKVLQDYANKDSLKNQTKESLFICSVLDKGVGIDEIINFKVSSMKDIILSTFYHCTGSKRSPLEIESDLGDLIYDLRNWDPDSLEVHAFAETCKLYDRFYALCKFLNL